MRRRCVLPAFSPRGALAAAAIAAAAAAFASAGSGAVAGTAPVNTSKPTISGAAVEGNTLAASSGTWEGATPIAYTYAWQRCDSTSCSPIPGATAPTYTIATADVSFTLLVEVTATQAGGGNGKAQSDQTGVVVAGSAPALTEAPSVGGVPRVGETLTTTDGSWTGNPPPDFGYVWQRCNNAGAGCSAIGGQTARTYVVASDDLGSRLRSAVTATNSVGTATALSAATAVVTERVTPPSVRSQPNIVGTPRVGQTLTVETRYWSGTPPLKFYFAWQRCNSGGRCTTIPGANAQTYIPTANDIGYRLRALVAASNSAGTRSIESNLTAVPVAGSTAAPVLKTAPWVTGGATENSTVFATAGSWSGASPVKLAYAWQRCDTRGLTCITITGATGNSYKLTAADAGHTVRVQVTATNAGGSTTAISVPTLIIAASSVHAGVSTPAGLIKLGDGTNSIPVENVALPQRLIVSGVSFSPARLATRAPFTARFRVTDTRGYAVRGALVYVLGLPYGLLAPAPESQTDTAGYATLELQPSPRLSLRRGAIVMFIRARKPSGSLLGGISTRRLVQLGVGR